MQELLQNDIFQIFGTVNAQCALLAKHAGAKAIYLSGGAMSAAMGIPDTGQLFMEDILIDLNRITEVCDLPILVDIDTGWGNLTLLSHAIPQFILAGANALQIEDQVSAKKRCGHLSGKELVSTTEMVERIHACKDERLTIVARTDAFAVEGLDAALERASAYQHAGAHVIFPESLTELSQYQQFSEALDLPILANITEFGKTPLFTLEELKRVGVKCVLYPMSAFRMMNAAALTAYQTILATGTQQSLTDNMQTRKELYEIIGYDEGLK